MTSADPPRLRTLRGLPGGLAAALQSSEGDDLMPGPQELRDLERGVLGAAVGVATVAAIASGGHGGKVTILAKLLTFKLGIWVLPAMAGAGVGVCALEVSTLIQSATSHEEARSLPASNEAHGAPRTPARETKAPAAQTSAPLGEGALPPSARSAPAPHPPPIDAPQAYQGAPTPIELAEISEVDLIERAHRAIADDLVRAQSSLMEHERRFPNGTFVQEREAIAIEVLVRQGNLAGARARAARFFVRFPSSTYADHIESLLRTK